MYDRLYKLGQLSAVEGGENARIFIDHWIQKHLETLAYII